ncbi:MAG TPA: alpha/beta hydrolase [Terracidiphilus sp.]
MKLILALAAGSYLLLLAAFFVTQRRFLYYPSHRWVPLGEAHANRAFKEISLTTEDGIELKAWYAPATSKHLTIVFFHGNADCLYTAAEVADPYIAAGYGFLLAEYRGYSGLAGAPSEAGIYKDGRAYMQWLAAHGVGSGSVVLFGHSLGTGVAVEMAREFPVRGVMLLAPYLSIAKLAQIHFPFFPARYIALDRFQNDEKIGELHEPVLIVNGAEDRVIPPVQGQRLFALANAPKEYRSLPDRGHNDGFDEFGAVSLEWLEQI